MTGYIKCSECDGKGYIERERVARWIDRDTPPDLEGYNETCDQCQGDGTVNQEDE